MQGTLGWLSPLGPPFPLNAMAGFSQMAACDEPFHLRCARVHKRHSLNKRERKKQDEAASVIIFQAFDVFLIRRENVIRPYVGLIVPKTEIKHLNVCESGEQSDGDGGE